MHYILISDNEQLVHLKNKIKHQRINIQESIKCKHKNDQA